MEAPWPSGARLTCCSARAAPWPSRRGSCRPPTPLGPDAQPRTAQPERVARAGPPRLPQSKRSFQGRLCYAAGARLSSRRFQCGFHTDREKNVKMETSREREPGRTGAARPRRSRHNDAAPGRGLTSASLCGRLRVPRRKALHRHPGDSSLEKGSVDGGSVRFRRRVPSKRGDLTLPREGPGP